MHGPTTEIYAHGRVETRDAMREKAERGDVAGGQNYGYDNRRLGAHVERVVVPGHADVVQRIFRSVAAGHGFCRIAKGLNAFAIPSPTGRGWAISRVRERVMRELYRGRQVYGKTRWERRRGTKRKVDMPESEWIVREFSAQRIVDESLWEEAHRRLARTRPERGVTRCLRERMLVDELAILSPLPGGPTWDRAALRVRLGEWHRLLRQTLQVARQLLRAAFVSCPRSPRVGGGASSAGRRPTKPYSKVVSMVPPG